MFEFMTSRLPLTRQAHRPERTCPVCCAGVADDDSYVAVRGMRIHGGCARYRSRRNGRSGGVGRLAG